MPETMILDTKHDYEWVIESPRVLTFDDLDYSPIARPPYAAPEEFINRWMHLYREIFWGAELQHAAVAPSLERLVRSNRVHALSDLYEELQKDKSPAGKGAVQRLDSIRLGYPTIFASTKNLWEALHEMSIYCSVVGPQSQAVRFLFWMLATERFEYRKKTAQRDQLHTVIVIDEAPATFSRRQQTVSGMPSTPVQLLPVTREHGIQFWVSSPSMTELDELLLPQFSVQVMMTPSDGKQVEALRKTFRLTPAQEAFAVRMPLGTAIGKRRGIDHPFVFTYPEFKKQKTPSADVIAAARERTRVFCEIHAPQPVVTTDASPGVAPTSLPTITAAPSILTTRERAFLGYLCERGVALVTETYDALHLKAMQGSRVQKKLVDLGLITETRVQVRSGRGQNQGTALTPTSTAYDHLRLTRPRQGKGGAQHAWLLRRLHDLIPHATIEVQSADIVIAYDEQHEPLLAALRNQGCEINPQAGDALAIEVELDPGKTAKRNIERNASNSTTTITAVLPAQLAHARKRCHHVIDVLRLIEELR